MVDEDPHRGDRTQPGQRRDSRRRPTDPPGPSGGATFRPAATGCRGPAPPPSASRLPDVHRRDRRPPTLDLVNGSEWPQPDTPIGGSVGSAVRSGITRGQHCRSPSLCHERSSHRRVAVTPGRGSASGRCCEASVRRPGRRYRRVLPDRRGWRFRVFLRCQHCATVRAMTLAIAPPVVRAVRPEDLPAVARHMRGDSRARARRPRPTPARRHRRPRRHVPGSAGDAPAGLPRRGTRRARRRRHRVRARRGPEAAVPAERGSRAATRAGASARSAGSGSTPGTAAWAWAGCSRPRPRGGRSARLRPGLPAHERVGPGGAGVLVELPRRGARARRAPGPPSVDGAFRDRPGGVHGRCGPRGLSRAGPSRDRVSGPAAGCARQRRHPRVVAAVTAVARDRAGLSLEQVADLGEQLDVGGVGRALLLAAAPPFLDHLQRHDHEEVGLTAAVRANVMSALMKLA